VTGLKHIWVTKALEFKNLQIRQKLIRLEKPPLNFYLGPYSHVVKMKSKYDLFSIQCIENPFY
jgi:hypothetical protein